MTSLRANVWLYAFIVAFYAALIGWWVFFFSNQADRLVERIVADGGVTDGVAVQAIKLETGESARMFLLEGGFLGLLMLGSIVLVLRAMKREQELGRQQRNFLSAVTHELRSPLASARLHLESLMLGRVPDEKRKRYLDNAHGDLDRLSLLVEDLLAARRFTEKGVEVETITLELDELIAPLVERLAELHHPAGAVVQLERNGRVPVRADPSALERIIDNLVNNAVKYGGDEPRVLVRLGTEAGRALIEVRDDGPGLRGEDAERLTQAFVRGGDENVRTRPGAGLGLFIVRELAEAHGGSFSLADRTDGDGAIARVSLPIDSAVLAEAAHG